MKLTDYEIEKNGEQWKCPLCDKWCKKMGLPTHFHRTHNPDYVNPGNSGQVGWNKGHTKATHSGIALYAKNLSQNSKAGLHKKRRPMTDANKLSVSDGMKKAHAEGRAHNIGSSRWNNTPSWPEQFFMQVVENEFDDKTYTRELPFKRYSLDFAWIEKKLCIEIDGSQHERFEHLKQSDQRKDLALQEAGWKVLRIKWSDMNTDTKKWIQIAKDFIHV